MKVYDTDERAIAVGARKRMLARAITIAIMALFSGLGIWLAYTFLWAPNKTALSPSTKTAVLAWEEKARTSNFPPSPQSWNRSEETLAGVKLL